MVKKRLTAAEVFEKILHYCKMRDEFGGVHTQGSYKMDFFKIFYDAYASGCVGEAANRKYGSDRKKTTCVADYVVHNENIYAYLHENWPQFKRYERMVADLCDWWNAWEYCMDACPYGIRDSPGLRPQKESPGVKQRAACGHERGLSPSGHDRQAKCECHPGPRPHWVRPIFEEI